MTPTARSLGLLRESGFICEAVEKWIPRLNRRRDLFGGFDILAIHGTRREVVLIQTTSAGHVADRVAKVQRLPVLPAILAAGVKVSIHGWAYRDGRWRCRIEEIHAADLPAVVVSSLPRRARRWRPVDLFGAVG
jgi:hypothetical protein